MANPETENSDAQQTPAFNGWTWAMGGALAAGLIVGGAMWFVGRGNNAAYEKQLEQHRQVIRLLEQKLNALNFSAVGNVPPATRDKKGETEP